MSSADDGHEHEERPFFYDISVALEQAREERAMIPDQDCGGCMGLGSHKRWCVVVVGKAASMLGPWSEQVEEWGDRIGGVPDSQDSANMLYSFASVIESRAHKARQMHQEGKPMDPCDCEEHQ